MSETKALLRRRGEGKEGDGTRSGDGDTKKCVGRGGDQRRVRQEEEEEEESSDCVRSISFTYTVDVVLLPPSF